MWDYSWNEMKKVIEEYIEEEHVPHSIIERALGPLQKNRRNGILNAHGKIMTHVIEITDSQWKRIQSLLDTDRNSNSKNINEPAVQKFPFDEVDALRREIKEESR